MIEACPTREFGELGILLFCYDLRRGERKLKTLKKLGGVWCLCTIQNAVECVGLFELNQCAEIGMLVLFSSLTSKIRFFYIYIQGRRYYINVYRLLPNHVQKGIRFNK